RGGFRFCRASPSWSPCCRSTSSVTGCATGSIRSCVRCKRGDERSGPATKRRFEMTDYKLISADSHVSEPTDLWVERVDKRYRDRAPRLAVNPGGKEGAYFLYEGHSPHPIGIGLAAGKSPQELAEFLT